MQHNLNYLPAQTTPSAPPPVAELIAEFRRCSPYDGGWNRLAHNDAVRFCRWPGQTLDCKKQDSPGKPAFPWPGASDQRLFVADDVIIGNVAECFEAFSRSWFAPKAGLTEESGYAVKLADHLVNVALRDELFTEVQLSASYREQYGWMVLHPHWDARLSIELRTVKLDEMIRYAQAAAQQAQGQPMPGAGVIAQLATALLDPTQDEAAAALLGHLYDLWMQATLPKGIESPPLRPARLKKAVAELRAGGEAELPVPFVVCNQPMIKALKPWVEFLMPTNVQGVEQAPYCFQRTFMAEVDVRAKIATEGWNPKWVEEAVKHKGKISAWMGSGETTVSTDPQHLTTRLAGQSSEYLMVSDPAGLIEVVYATYRQVDEDNVPGVRLTILHPCVGTEDGLCAWSGLLKGARGRMPYVVGPREVIDRPCLSSRGVPEILYSTQVLEKVQFDSTIDNASISVLPPVNTYAVGRRENYRFAPAAQNEVQPGREPQFMEVPTAGVVVADKILEQTRLRTDRYFGIENPNLQPGSGRSRRQLTSGTFLLTWAAAIQRTIDLCQERMSDAEFASITGAPAGWLEGKRSQFGLLASRLEFDIRELDPEYVAQMLKVVNEAVIPQDVAGITDRASWTRAQWRMVSPRLAREITVPDSTASQKLIDEVRNDIAQMFLGNEAAYRENDPTSGQRLAEAMKVVQQNPIYQQALQNPDSRFAQLMEKWGKSLQFNQQQQENRMIGRIGVRPQGDLT